MKSVRKDFTGDIIVELEDGGLVAGTRAYMDAEDAPKIAQLTKGQTVTLVCRGDGFLLESPMLKACRVP